MLKTSAASLQGLPRAWWRERNRAQALGIMGALAAGILLAWLPLAEAAALFFGIALLLLVIVRPWVGLALMLLAGPWGALESATFGIPIVDSGQLLFLLTVAAWLVASASRRRLVLAQTPLNVPLALFILVAGLTLLNASSLATGTRELLKWLEIALLVFLVVDVVASPRGLRPWPAAMQIGSRGLVAILLVAGMSQALVGIWQFALRGSGPDHFAIAGGAFYRAYGTFQQPNPYGGFMSWMALLATGTLLGLVAALRRGRIGAVLRASWHWWLFVAIAAALTVLALVLSWSRGAWLAFAAGGAVLLVFLPRDRRIGVGLLLAVGFLLLAAWGSDLIPQPLIARLSSFTADLRFGDVRGVDINDANYAVIERLAHWQAAIEMARDHFWLGVGFGNYEPAYPAYALANWPFPLGHAHNYYLNLLAEVGLVGTLAYGLLWTTILVQTIFLLGRLDWPRRGIALGLLGAWTALSVHHLLDKLYVNNLYLHLGVMLGLLQVLWRDVEQRNVA